MQVIKLPCDSGTDGDEIIVSIHPEEKQIMIEVSEGENFSTIFLDEEKTNKLANTLLNCFKK